MIKAEVGRKDLTGQLRFDYQLLFSFVVLTLLGILTIYSASRGAGSGRALEREHIRQIYWAIIGGILFILILFINYQRMSEFALAIYVVSILLLLLTLLLGRRVRGARSWLNVIGNLGFQPSELIKIGLIIVLATFLEKVGEEIRRLKNVILTLLIIFLPVGLILLQPDFGTALVYLPIGLVMIFFAGIRYTHLISLLIIFSIAISLPLLATYSKLTSDSAFAFFQILDDTTIVFTISLSFGLLAFIFFLIFNLTKKELMLKARNIFLIFFCGLFLSMLLGKGLRPYQRERLVVFIKPEIDPFGAGYNIIQSKIAVGAGGLFGKGLLRGTQSQLGFLPERSTDFIFSIFAEEWGFVGSLFLLAIYGLFIYRATLVIFNSKDRFGSLMASGLVGMFLFHIVVNIGMTIGIMPITGIPLPFLSYGGSFLLTSMIGTSILFNISMRRYVR